MKQGKRGVVEVQFNWIFILIAGALILFLFSSIILKQKTSADSTAQTTLLKDITSIAIGSEATTGITKELSLSKATLSFGCNSIRVGQKSQPIQQMMIFSPSILQTPLIVHTREWSLPYRATNVIYLSSPKVRYVLIGDNALAKQINKSMPEKFLIDYYPSYAGASGFSSAELQDDDHIRIVFFDQTPFDNANNAPSNPTLFSKLSKKSSKEASVLVISGDQNLGIAKFYAKAQTGFQLQGSVDYLKEEMLIGAIFTDTPEQYQCIQGNMLKRLRTVSDIHDIRRQRLYADTLDPFHPLNRCNSAYADGGDAHADLVTLKGASASFNQLYDAAYAPSTILSSGLTAVNKDLERLSCPLLY